jgi:copper(I)-binding protein
MAWIRGKITITATREVSAMTFQELEQLKQRDIHLLENSHFVVERSELHELKDAEDVAEPIRA